MNDINDIAAEAAVLASIIQNPDMYFVDTGLEPRHFFEEENGYLYWALGSLLKAGSSIDAFNILQVLARNPGTKKRADEIMSIRAINDFISMSPTIARKSVEDYKLVANAIVSCAMRREMFGTLVEMENMCAASEVSDDFESEIYSRLDNIIKTYKSGTDITFLGEHVDEIWNDIQARKRGDITPLEFPWPELNRFVTMEPSTVVNFSGPRKIGKSCVALSIAVHLLKQDRAILYLDSELSENLFTKRMLSHLTRIPFAKLKYGTYDDEEEAKLNDAKEWLKTRKIVHKYMPVIDSASLQLVAKRAMAVMDGYDVLIMDYIKGNSTTDAFSTYAVLGTVTDTLHEIAGTLKIPVVSLSQSTDDGTRVADSSKIGRNVDSLVMLMYKTPEEIQRDGRECGNRKMFVAANRNGEQHLDSSIDYVDLEFEGNYVTYRSADRQHQIEVPY